MTGQSIEELRTFLVDRAGDLLRVLVTYDRTGYHVHHRRDDLDPERIEARARAVYSDLMRSDSTSDDIIETELGDLSASLQVRSEAVIVHLPLAREQGVIVSLEPEAGSDLTTFLGACLDRL